MRGPVQGDARPAPRRSAPLDMATLDRPTVAAQCARGLAYGAGLYVLFDLLRRWFP